MQPTHRPIPLIVVDATAAVLEGPTEEPTEEPRASSMEVSKLTATTTCHFAGLGEEWRHSCRGGYE